MQNAPPRPLSDLFPVHLGRYTLIDILGQGGMGAVFLAAQSGAENFRRYVAVKTLLPGYRHNEEVAAMFVKEATSLSTANHPNVVQTYDLFRHDDTLYAALEFVHGHDLRDVMSHMEAAHAKPAPQVVCCLINQVAQGLDYIHTLRDDLDNGPRQLVHRDINPKNILLGFDGSVKIADFGLLRSGNSNTAETTLRGTLGYVAPEQLTDGPVDQRADIFALGCVMFELLVGRPLFGQSESEQILNRKLQRVPDAAALLPADHGAFVPLLQRMLAPEPTDRYPSVAALQTDLDALTQSFPATSLSKGAWLRQHYPEEEKRWSARKEHYARLMQTSEFESLRTAPEGMAPPRSSTAPVPISYRPASPNQVNILTRSLWYVAVVAVISLSVAGLLYMVATHPVQAERAHGAAHETQAND